MHHSCYEIVLHWSSLDWETLVSESASENQTTIIVTTMGRVQFQDSKPKSFYQTFLLSSNSDNVWKIVSDTYRFMEAPPSSAGLWRLNDVRMVCCTCLNLEWCAVKIEWYANSVLNVFECKRKWCAMMWEWCVVRMFECRMLCYI